MLKLGEFLRQGCQHTDLELLGLQHTRSDFANATNKCSTKDFNVTKRY
jgi:hypothetical protein